MRGRRSRTPTRGPTPTRGRTPTGRPIARAAIGATLAALALLIAAAGVAVAHARLVASTPGAGERVASTPSELRLVFSEPLDAGYTSVDLLGPDGTAIAAGPGVLDPSDNRVYVVPLPALADGVFTVSWRTLSAADGHAETGSFSFGIGAGAAVGSGSDGGATAGGHGGGSDEGAGHGGSAAAQATFVLDAGVLLAFGLMVIAWVVLEPLGRGIPPQLLAGAGVALLAAAVGALLLIAVAAAEVSADPVQYAIRTRPGLLLLGRAAVGAFGGAAVLVFVRLRRAGAAGDVAMFAGAAALGLTALGGHAAAFGSPVPIAADAIHIGAAATWVAGLTVLAVLATVGRADAGTLRAIVPRFSPLALVAIALMALTGTYAAWLETGDFTAFDDPYVRLLAIKAVVALAAFAVGAANFLLDPGGRRLGGLGRRVGVEAGLAVVVVVVTAALTNAAPAAGGRPITLADATTSTAGASAGVGASLAVAPGRPGPNRFVATVTGLPGGAPTPSVRLSLDRLDAPAPPIDQPLGAEADGQFGADVGALPADSRWEASVVVSTPDGTQVARRRFVLGLGANGLTDGRALPPIDPALASAVLLLALGLLATVFAVAGGRVPRVEPRTGRVALLLAGPLGAALGAAIILVGPRG